MAAMRADIAHALESVFKQLTPPQLTTLATNALGPLDVIHFIGLRPGLTDWFRFRADLIARNVKHFHTVVHQAAGPDFIFGADNYPASLSLFAGHDQTRWGEFSDFASPLISHVDAFPMKTFVAWAKWFQHCFRKWPRPGAQAGLSLGGYADLAMPTMWPILPWASQIANIAIFPCARLCAWTWQRPSSICPRTCPPIPSPRRRRAVDWPLPIVQQLMARCAGTGL